jgi:2-amino-4-hydroxy-6-hydroxymethyldihydropteridine diphosphokinase
MVATPLREPVAAYVALGANLGDAAHSVRAALAALAQLPHTRLVQASSLFETAPHQAHGPVYVNAVAHVQTLMNAPDLLTALQALEQAAGRVRSYTNAPRTLDLDILFYGDATISSGSLTVPHPRWAERAFVLWPLKELAPERVNPAMLAAVADQQVSRLP